MGIMHRIRPAAVLIVSLPLLGLDCPENNSALVAPPVTGTVQGQVTANGAPLPGVNVTLSTGATATTGANGEYSFAEVTEGVHTATISGFPADVTFPATSRAFAITAEGQTVIVPFAGSRVGAAISGTATLDGLPLSNATVTVTDAGGTPRTGMTDALGLFAFSGLAAGGYIVEIAPPDGTTCDPGIHVTLGTGETAIVSLACTTDPSLAIVFLGIPEGQGDVAPGEYLVAVREGIAGPVLGQVPERFVVTGANPFLFRNQSHLGMTDVARIVDLDGFQAGGGDLAPAASPLVGFSQYGWCSELDLLAFSPAMVRFRDADGTLVSEQALTSLPDNADDSDPVCGFVNNPDPDRVVEVELDTEGTHVRIFGACLRNAPADDLEGRCAP